MDRNKDLENFLGELMSADASGISAPSPALVAEARQKVLLHKKQVKKRSSISDLFTFLSGLNVKLYHVGISVLLVSAGIFYLNEPSYHSGDSSGFMQYKESLSITNTTISVNSSTMLTSIPTTVIRN